jgi:hypothetical protein
MSFDGLPDPAIDHTGVRGRAPDAVLQQLAPIGFGRKICGDLAAAERREWWIGNGSGAYAAGTVAQSLTRRYHGLLVAPVDPPLGRCLVLTKADAALVVGDHRVPQFTNRWASGPWIRRVTAVSKTSSSTAPSRSGGLRSATSASSSGSGWNRAQTRPTSPGA